MTPLTKNNVDDDFIKSRRRNALLTKCFQICLAFQIKSQRNKNENNVSSVF